MKLFCSEMNEELTGQPVSGGTATIPTQSEFDDSVGRIGVWRAYPEQHRAFASAAIMDLVQSPDGFITVDMVLARIHENDRPHLPAPVTFGDLASALSAKHTIRLRTPEGEVSSFIAFSAMLPATGSHRSEVIGALVPGPIGSTVRAGPGEDRLSVALRAANVGAWDLDLATGFSVWTEHTAEVLGLTYTGDAVPSDAWRTAIAAEDLPLVDSAIHLARTSGKPFIVEFRMAGSGEGPQRWAEARGLLVRDAHGRPERLVGVVCDITDRKNREAQAAKAADRVRAILESTTDCVYLVDRDWRFTFINQRATEQIARGRNLNGLRLWEAFPEAVGSTFWHYFHRSMNEGVAAEFEAFYPPAGAWYEVSVNPIDEGLAVFFRNATVRHAAALALRESEEKLRFALNAGRLVIWEYDSASGFVRRSESALDVLGIASGSLESFLARVLPEDRERLQREVRAALETGADLKTSFAFRRPDGRCVQLAGRGRVLDGVPGPKRRILGVCFEYGERMPTEQAVLPTGDITGLQIRAARGALRWSVRELAEASHISESTIKRFEDEEGPVEAREATVAAVRSALENGGIEFISYGDGRSGIRPR